ncbi:MAG: hypothetical protein H0U62_08570 [Actinobacteria bacterium]|jgi:hypothetical protein|nr:hypothetical protein [Actinomycetota bacterium]
MTSVLSLTTLFGTAEGETHVLRELIFEPYWFGILALGAFVALLALLWSFRNTLALDPHPASEADTDAGKADPDSGRGSSR